MESIMKRFEITKKRKLNDNITWLVVYAPLVARRGKTGTVYHPSD